MSSYYDDTLDPATGLPKNKAATIGAVPNLLGQPGVGSTLGTTGYSGGGTGAPGGAPGGRGSYLDTISNDPAYSQLLKDLSAQGISDEAGARAAGQRGFIQFGEVPEGLDPQGWGDATTRELARKNTEAGFSSTARLAKQFADQVRTIKRTLAARGALRSGEFGHQLGEEQQRFATAGYDSRQRLVDYIAAVNQGLAAAQRARAGQQAAGINEAANRAVASGVNPGAPAPPPVAPPPAAPPPGSAAPVPPDYYSNIPGTPGYRKPLLDPYGGGF